LIYVTSLLSLYDEPDYSFIGRAVYTPGQSAGVCLKCAVKGRSRDFRRALQDFYWLIPPEASLNPGSRVQVNLATAAPKRWSHIESAGKLDYTGGVGTSIVLIQKGDKL